MEAYLANLGKSFPFFLFEVWKSINLPPPALHQLDMAMWLQDGGQKGRNEGSVRRIGIKAFRGASKTWITAAYCGWRLYRNPNERETVISKSQQHAMDTLHMVRRWMDQIDFLKHLKPSKAKDPQDRDSAIRFDVGPSKSDRSASFTAYGYQGQITGSRSTLIVPDDIETKQNTQTLEMRMRLRDDINEFDNMIIPGGDIIYLGTPHNEETLYDKLREAYTFRSWPARVPRSDEDVPDISPLYFDRDYQEALMTMRRRLTEAA